MLQKKNELLEGEQDIQVSLCVIARLCSSISFRPKYPQGYYIGLVTDLQQTFNLLLFASSDIRALCGLITCLILTPIISISLLQIWSSLYDRYIDQVIIIYSYTNPVTIV